MSDTQMPDLSGFDGPSELPAARPTQAFNPQGTAAPAPQQRGRPIHEAHLRDSEATNQKAKQMHAQAQADQHIPRAEEGLEEEKFTHGSMLSPQQIDDLVNAQTQPQAPQSAPRPMGAPPRQTKAPTAPPVLAKEAPARIRDISELFTAGSVKKTLNISGFNLTLKSLNSEEYNKAWAMACLYPEGTSREVALRQYLLALSCVSINGVPTESLCDKSDITDPVSRRLNVFARLDNELVRRFFDQGYLKVREETVTLLDNLGAEVDQAANFTQPTR